MSPLPAGEGLGYFEEVSEEQIPRQFLPAIKQGVVSAAENGIMAGYPVVDISVTVTGGSFDQQDSSDLAFTAAGSMAFRDAASKAHPVLLEPIVSVEVVTPEQYVGEVIADLNARGGKIEATRLRGGDRIVDATVPIGKMFGYATAIRSLTQGRALYTTQFSHYAEVPPERSAKIMAGWGYV